MTDLIGKIFDGKYRLTRLIGEGGMGAVYEAEHTRIERKVAVKVMHPEFSTTSDVADRFFREAQASSAIGHPNIIEIFDVGMSDDGTAFIVMELLEGESLSDRMEGTGKIPHDAAVATILQVLSALSMAHKKGIIHRDLKPDNVFLSIDNRGRHEVKLLDFGIAKVQGELEGDQGLTKTGTVLGTPNYMSPEQARGKDIDGRIDIWSAGVMLYEMLCGALPFQGESYNAVLSDILLESPRPLKLLSPDTPDTLIKVVERAMAKDRDRRYPDVQAMIEDLMVFYGDMESLMSDSAHSALKSSIAPPPVENYKKNPSLGDTAALAPDPGIIKAMSPAMSRVGNVTFRELEFGKSNDTEPHRPRRTLLWILSSLLVLAFAVFAGMAFHSKRADQTVGEAGMALLQGFRTSLEESPWSPFKKPPAVPPEISEPTFAPMPDPPEGAIENTDDFVEWDDDYVTLRILGTTPKSKIVLSGKPILSRTVLNKSSKTMNLRVTHPGKHPFVEKIVPSEDLIIDSTPRKSRKGKRKKSKRKGHKKK